MYKFKNLSLELITIQILRLHWNHNYTIILNIKRSYREVFWNISVDPNIIVRKYILISWKLDDKHITYNLLK